jgi:hypothetical protein
MCYIIPEASQQATGFSSEKRTWIFGTSYVIGRQKRFVFLQVRVSSAAYSGIPVPFSLLEEFDGMTRLCIIVSACALSVAGCASDIGTQSPYPRRYPGQSSGSETLNRELSVWRQIINNGRAIADSATRSRGYW